MCFNNYDFATPGSPISSTLIFPLIFIPSAIIFVFPLTIYKSRAYLTSVIPKISGQIEPASRVSK